LADLPQQTTQNDANDHNIVVDASGNAVAGIIDFGDMVHTARVNELAICIAYGV
jgi:Ser/Thr protein kinase RdoA (MazF antagonist)